METEGFARNRTTKSSDRTLTSIASGHKLMDSQCHQNVPDIPPSGKVVRSSIGRQPTKSAFSWSLLSDTWVPEICAVFLSIACSCTIVVLLTRWDGSSVPPLARGVTVNAIVSVLATASKSAMLFVVAACIAQLKWMWFSQKRTLVSIQVFDDATRGPLGAMYLLCNSTVTSLASMGAIITVLALAFDPFVQQAVTTPTLPVGIPSTAAIARQAFGYFSEEAVGGIEVSQIVRNAIWSTSSYDQSPTCPKTDCSWPTVKTVAVCEACKKVTPLITKSWDLSKLSAEYQNNATSYKRFGIEISLDGLPPVNLSLAMVPSWPSGLEFIDRIKTCHVSTVRSIVWDYESLSGRSLYDWNYTSEFPTEKGPTQVVHPLALYVQTNVSWLEGVPQINDSTICALDLCMKEYDVDTKNDLPRIEVKNWQFGQKFTYSWSTESIELSFGGLADVSLPISQDHSIRCWQPLGGDRLPLSAYNVSTINDYPSVPEMFSFCDNPNNHGSQAGHLNLHGLIDTTNPLHGNSSESALISIIYPDDVDIVSQESASIDVGPLGDSEASSDDYNHHMHNKFEDTIARAAEALSARMLEQPQAGDVLGEVISMLPKVKVRWYWLTLPGLLTLSAAVLLGVTIWSTHRNHIPLWKTSLIASFFHGVDQDLVPQGHDLKVSNMEGDAEQLHVQLKPCDISGRLIFG